MELYRLSYEFTKVVSPIDGQSSRYYMTQGNLVNQDQTLLTTVVSVDPMYVYFEMDEPTLPRYLRRRSTRGRSSARRAQRCPSPWGCKARRLPAQGDDQLRQQPGQPSDGHDPACELSSRTRCPRGAGD